jgi:hypothetical protein
MSTTVEELTELHVSREAAVARYLEALQAYYPAATTAHEILLDHDGSIIVAVPMPDDDDDSMALGEHMAHLGTELLLETDTSIVLSQRPVATFEPIQQRPS